MNNHEAHYYLEELQRMMTQHRGIFSEEFVHANGMAILALELKEGKWILTDFPDEQTYRCSVCNTIWTFIDGTPEDNGAFFCPNCGADMRGEQDE